MPEDVAALHTEIGRLTGLLAPYRCEYCGNRLATKGHTRNTSGGVTILGCPAVPPGTARIQHMTIAPWPPR